MAYDEETAMRFRDAIGGLEGIEEKRMMGGVCFMLNGNMIGGADRAKDGTRRFMFRVGKENRAEGEKLPGAQPMEMGGRQMNGFFFVDADENDDAVVRQWLSLALAYNAELPPK